MKVAFWNINTGTTSFTARRQTFTTWCAEVAPDLLLLEEVGNTLLDPVSTLEGLANMTYINHVNTLDVNLNASTKNLVALKKTASVLDFTATALKFPTLSQKRQLLKVTCTDIDPTLYLWVIHANASKKGGTNAVAKVRDHLATDGGKNSIVGGDFNLSYTLANVANKRNSKDWQGNPLTFTQWNKSGSSIPSAASLGLTSPITTTIKTNAVLDYVLYGTGRTVTAKKNCKLQSTWRDILNQFDHCPVVYEIG